jgi:peptidoglycan/LPS O-acetylase OafA/YrhL
MAASSQDPAAPSRRNNIGTLRMLGALAVLLGHSWVLTSEDGRTLGPVSQALADVTGFRLGLAGLGLAMFFVISGYLVSASYERRQSLVAYVEARVLRIYPALWAAIAFMVVVGLFLSPYGPLEYLKSHKTLVFIAGGASLVDMNYLLPGVFTDNPSDAVNGSLWTLPVEIRMYLFVAVVGLLGLLGRRALFNVVVAAAVAAGVIWPGSVPLLSDPNHAEISTFFVAGAALYVNRDAVPLRGAGLIALVALAAALSWTDAYGLAFALAFSYAVLLLGFTKRVRLPDLAARGDFSYGTYLYAFFVTQLWVSALGPGEPALIAGLTLVCTLPLAVASWFLVESPALRLKGALMASKLTRRSVIVPRGEQKGTGGLP